MAQDISARVAWALKKALTPAREKESRATGTATFVRKDADGTGWVRLAGNDFDTPVSGPMVAEASEGDAVTYSIVGGRVTITGNRSAPAVGQRFVGSAIKTVRKIAVSAGELAKAAKDVADATNQFFWADGNGVHVSTEENNPTGTQNVLLNALGMLFRNGTNNLLALVTGNSPGVAIYDGHGNDSGNITASISAAGVVLGPAGRNQTTVAPDALRMSNAQHMTTLEVAEAGTGSAEVSESFAQGSTWQNFSFSISPAVTQGSTIRVDLVGDMTNDGPLAY